MAEKLRGGSARADLLRLLAELEHPLDHLDLQGAPHDWVGYVHVPDTPPVQQVRAGTARTRKKPSVESKAASSHASARAPLRMSGVFAVTEVIEHPASERTKSKLLPTEATPFRANDPRLAVGERTVRLRESDLCSRARLLPALKRWLGHAVQGPFDERRLADQIARQSVVDRLPCLPRLGWHSELLVLFDFAEATWPYRFDMIRLRHWLLQSRGGTGMRCLTGQHGPGGEWRDWTDRQQRWPDAKQAGWPAPGGRVLVVSDLGLHTDHEEASWPAPWFDLFKAMTASELEVLVLAPAVAWRLPLEALRGVTLLRWTGDQPFRPARHTGVRSESASAVADLLAMVAACRRVDPPLLRAFRRLLGPAGSDAALEGVVWTHPDVEAGSACWIRRDRALPHLQRFKTLVPALQDQVHALSQSHHVHLAPILRHEEALLQDHWAGPEARGKWRGQTEKATAFFATLGRSLASDSGGDRASGLWRDAAMAVVQRVSGEDPEAVPVAFMDLARQLYAEPIDRKTPAWVALEALRTEAAARDCWLVHDLASDELRLQDRRPVPGPFLRLLHGPLRASMVDLRLGTARHRERRAMKAGVPFEHRIGKGSELAKFEIRTPDITLRAMALARPRGFEGWGWRDGRLSLEWPREFAYFGGAPTVEWDGSVDKRARGLPVLSLNQGAPMVLSRPRVGGGGYLSPPAQAVEFSCQSDAYGLCLDLTVSKFQLVSLTHEPELTRALGFVRTGQSPSIRQRFRYLEPGTFHMGSPNGSGDSEERPRHLVRLTRGFWLADTPCTQGLWDAVMGTNPSHFKDRPDATARPVENVSWEEVQGFLRRLNGQLPPWLVMDLPTEAEWEYACRAGSETAYYWGDEFDKKRANVDVKGSPGETSEVKRYEANGWGLYDMHGNVWEWCLDGMREYEEGEEEDPRGPEGASCVLRGGSWYVPPVSASSASRIEFHPGVPNNFGFRLAMRSASRRPEGSVNPAAQADGRKRSSQKEEWPFPREKSTTEAKWPFPVSDKKPKKSRPKKKLE